MLLSTRTSSPASKLFTLLTLIGLMAMVLLAAAASSASARSHSATTRTHHAKTTRSRHSHRAKNARARRSATAKTTHKRRKPVKTTPPVKPPVTSPTPVTPKEVTAPSTPISAEAPGQTSSEAPTKGTSSAPTIAYTCNLVASPSGSDSTGDGSVANPFQTLVKLDAALAPGQTGCLRGGVYGSINTLHRLSTNGTSTGRITIAPYPGENPTVVGWVDIEASYTTIYGLKIDGSNTFYDENTNPACPGPSSQGLDIAGANDVFEHNDYYQSVASLHGNGLGVGFWGDADNTVIRYNRIHEVGSCTQHDHLIYLASGNNVQIYDNWLYDDHNGFAVTAYPHPTNARIFSNVMYDTGMGLNFGDNGTSTVSGNEAWNNVVTNSVNVLGDEGEMLQAVLVMCSDLDGSSTGNKIFDNDSFDNPQGVSAINSHLSSAQISLTNTSSVNPEFADASAGDFAVPATSPVASWGLWNGGEGQPTVSASKSRATVASIAKRHSHRASIARRRARTASTTHRRAS
jgi:hypothetical protein